VQRYGSQRPWVRWLTVVTVVALGLSSCGWLVWAALYNATPQVSSRLVSFTVANEHRVDVVVQVDRTAAVESICRVVARSFDHSVVGELVFRVPSRAASSVTVADSVTTDRAAVAAILEGCTTAEQSQPR
jgi:hypothetical protein